MRSKRVASAQKKKRTDAQLARTEPIDRKHERAQTRIRTQRHQQNPHAHTRFHTRTRTHRRACSTSTHNDSTESESQACTQPKRREREHGGPRKGHLAAPDFMHELQCNAAIPDDDNASRGLQPTPESSMQEASVRNRTANVTEMRRSATSAPLCFQCRAATGHAGCLKSSARCSE